jgi:hypothetical protein
MSKQFFNTKKLKEIPINKIALALGYKIDQIPHGWIEKDLSRSKKNTSMNFWKRTNSWYRYSEDIGGDTIALVQYHMACDFKAACTYLSNNFL